MSNNSQNLHRDPEARKTMRQARKQIKRNRQPKPARRKNWMPDNFDDLDTLYDLPQTERVMPRGERERRRDIVDAAAATLGEQASPDGEPPTMENPASLQGVVIEVSSGLCCVDLEGRRLMCALRGSLTAHDTGFTNVVAVGDKVVVSESSSAQGVVEAVLPRRSVLARPDVFHNHLKQVIAANADQLLVVASWRDPIFWPELTDRYLIAAERNNLASIICVNKVDLAADMADCQVALRPYLDLGHRVLFTSALTGTGVSELREVLRGRMTVLAGLSGVGKSSLLLAAQPGLQLRTGEVSERSREGQHITTQVNLIRLDIGGFVADTPGIREFGLSGLQRAELARFYPEMTALQGSCRFSDCSHLHEPGCAVQAAVQQGSVSATRYHSYQKIYECLPS